jgi:hypothetical protein
MEKDCRILLMAYFAVLVLSACATFGDKNHDNRWHEVESQYRKDCENWTKENGPKRLERKPGEQYMATQDVIALRCSESPEICTPPKKPTELRYFENYWGEPVTGEYCSSYHYDEDRSHVRFPN